MKAAVCEGYGSPESVVIRDIEKPRPKDDEILVKVYAAPVNSGDSRIRALRVPRGLALPLRLQLGWSGPKRKVLGLEFSGTVADAGSSVTRFKPGDEVVGTTWFDFGCHAEYLAVKADAAVVLKPSELSHEEAVSLLFGGTTALYFFRKGELKSGDDVLINGASGAVGTMAVQIAKHMGARVTGVCGPSHIELVKNLGADVVIDYSREDFTKRDVRYDVIMETVGNAPFSRIKHLLKPGGRFLLVNGNLPQMIAAGFNKQVIGGTASGDAETCAQLMELARSGAIKPVIDRSFPLEQAAEAHRHVDSGHKTGSVVLTMAS